MHLSSLYISYLCFLIFFLCLFFLHLLASLNSLAFCLITYSNIFSSCISSHAIFSPNLISLLFFYFHLSSGCIVYAGLFVLYSNCIPFHIFSFFLGAFINSLIKCSSSHRLIVCVWCGRQQHRPLSYHVWSDSAHCRWPGSWRNIWNSKSEHVVIVVLMLSKSKRQTKQHKLKTVSQDANRNRCAAHYMLL